MERYHNRPGIAWPVYGTPRRRRRGSLNLDSTWPPPPRCATRSPGPTTTESGARANITSPRSPAWYDDVPTYCSPCSATAPCTDPQPPCCLTKHIGAPFGGADADRVDRAPRPVRLATRAQLVQEQAVLQLSLARTRACVHSVKRRCAVGPHGPNTGGSCC
jgi:hypothetical protein